MTKKSNTELFDIYISNIASHAMHLATDSGTIKMGALPDVWVEYYVEQKDDYPNVWDNCYVLENNKRRSLGNRHAMASHYSQLCAKAIRAFMKEHNDIT